MFLKHRNNFVSCFEMAAKFKMAANVEQHFA